MIGFFGGICLSVVFLSTAWFGVASQDSYLFLDSPGISSLLVFLITAEICLFALCLIGIFVIPRTVFSSLFMMSMVTPIAFVVALLRQGFSYSLSILVIGISSWIFAFFIRIIRADADPRR